mgnify:CR=1 FL=1
MRKNECTRRFLTGWVVLMLTATMAWAAGPQLTDQPTDAEIEAYAVYWAGAIRDSQTASGVTDAANKLTQAYSLQTDASYTFAKIASRQLLDVLGDMDETDLLVDIKTANAAMAISLMPQVAIQSVLKDLIVDDRPVVRYFGWSGYGNIRLLLMTQGGTALSTFEDSVKTRLANETDPRVLGMLIDAIDLPPRLPEGMDEEMYNATSAMLLTELTSNLPTYARYCATSNAEWSDTCAVAISATQRRLTYARSLDPEAALTAEQLQGVVDLMTVAAEVYAEGSTSVDELQVETVLLMRECEDLLNDSVKQTKGLMRSALSGKNADWKAHATKVQLAAMDWTMNLSEMGVVATDLDSLMPPAEDDADAETATDEGAAE